MTRGEAGALVGRRGEPGTPRLRGAAACRGAAGRRVAAGALLVGGAALGWWLAGRPARAVAGAGLGLALPVALILSGAARRVVDSERRRGDRAPSTVVAPVRAGNRPAGAVPEASPGSNGPAVAVLVPARDEAGHLPALIEDLGRQDLAAGPGAPISLRVVVVDDRSVDGTGAAAEAAIRSAGLDGGVVRRDGPGGAKGDALRAVPADAVLDAEVLVVLDADARVSPDFIRRVAEHRAAGEAAFTARRRILWPDRLRLARLQDDEQALDAWLLAGRIGLGGGGELRGNGMAVTPDALAAAGGWPGGVLTEDLELSTALLATGVRVAWAGDLEVAETGVATVGALARQRLRWSEGSARRLLAQLPRALSSPLASPAARLDLALYAGQLVVPPVVAGAAARAFTGTGITAAGSLLGVYVGAGSLLAWDAIGGLRGATGPASRAARAVAVGAFSTQWLVAGPVALARIALLRRPPRFAPTRGRLVPAAAGVLRS